jgi:tRNA(fMet)-specific endonuclease VapC
MTSSRDMLDTNIISDLIRHPGGKAADKIRKIGTDGLCVSIITAAELRFGIVKRASAQLTELIGQVLVEIEVLPLAAPADDVYARIRNDLEKAGKPIGPNDLLIAAHALTLGATLVTANAHEFRRVPELKVENWLA